MGGHLGLQAMLGANTGVKCPQNLTSRRPRRDVLRPVFLLGLFVAVHQPGIVAQRLKRLPAMRETRVRFLGREDPLETGESHGRRSLVGYSSWGCKESDTTE